MLRVKELRIEKGLNQKDLAQKVGVSLQSISGYESGYNYPSVDVLIKLADTLEVSTDYILGREAETGLIEIKNELTPVENTVLSKFRKLKQVYQTRVVSYIDELTTLSY